VIALCCSKLVLVVVFLVAVNQTASPIDKGLASASEPIAGIALLLVAAFAPYLAYKFISFVGFDISHAMASEQEAKSALTHPMPVSVGVPLASRARSILASSGGRAGVTTTGSDTGPGSPGPTSASPVSRKPLADAAPASADSVATPAAAGGGDAAAGSVAAGGPVGVGLVVAGQAMGKLANIGPRVGKQLADTPSGRSGHAAPAHPQQSEKPTRAPASSSGPGSENPWLTPRTPQPAMIPEPPRSEPIPHTKPPET
jgi:DNA processing protein